MKNRTIIGVQKEHLITRNITFIDQEHRDFYIGKQVTAEKIFRAKKKDGVVELEFSFDSSALAGKIVVVFEHLYYSEKEIASHADINDKNQTVTFKVENPPEEKPPEDHPTIPKTGDETQIALYIILAIISASVLGYNIYKKRRKGN